MYWRLFLVAIMCVCTVNPLCAANNTPAPTPQPEFSEPLFKPFIERYVLDELKALRTELHQFQAMMEKRLADTQLSVSDRALRYSADTMNNIFIVITATASLLVLLGWNSCEICAHGWKMWSIRRWKTSRRNIA